MGDGLLWFLPFCFITRPDWTILSCWLQLCTKHSDCSLALSANSIYSNKAKPSPTFSKMSCLPPFWISLHRNWWRLTTEKTESYPSSRIISATFWRSVGCKHGDVAWIFPTMSTSKDNTKGRCQVPFWWSRSTEILGNAHTGLCWYHLNWVVKVHTIVIIQEFYDGI